MDNSNSIPLKALNITEPIDYQLIMSKANNLILVIEYLIKA